MMRRAKSPKTVGDCREEIACELLLPVTATRRVLGSCRCSLNGTLSAEIEFLLDL